MWPWSASPARFRSSRFRFWPVRDQQRFDVDLPEASKPEPTQAVPILGFTEEWLDPDLPLGHRLLVHSRLVIGTHTVEVLGV
jgi:hypothetical protein